MIMATKKDGRTSNGAEDRGLTEDQQLVRGPRELIDGMRKLAERTKIPVATLWRQAAEEFLKRQKS